MLHLCKLQLVCLVAAAGAYSWSYDYALQTNRLDEQDQIAHWYLINCNGTALSGLTTQSQHKLKLFLLLPLQLATATALRTSVTSTQTCSI